MKDQTIIRLSADCMDGYIRLTHPYAERKSKRNQVIEVLNSGKSHQGTLVLDFDEDDYLIGIELNGCRKLLRAEFIDLLLDEP